MCLPTVSLVLHYLEATRIIFTLFIIAFRLEREFEEEIHFRLSAVVVVTVWDVNKREEHGVERRRDSFNARFMM